MGHQIRHLRIDPGSPERIVLPSIVDFDRVTPGRRGEDATRRGWLAGLRIFTASEGAVALARARDDRMKGSLSAT